MNVILKKIKEELENKHSNNLVYREIRLEDMFPFFESNKNKEFIKYLAFNQINNIEDLKDFISDKYKKSKENKELWITISEKTTLTWVAFIKITPYEDVVTGSIYMSPNFWTSGYAHESIKACAKIYFQESKKDYFYVLADKNNKISIKMNVSLGGEIIGEDFMFHENGSKIDLIKLILKKDNIKLEELENIL